MTSLSIEVLKKIVENIPDDYTLEFDNGKTTYNIDDKVEIGTMYVILGVTVVVLIGVYVVINGLKKER